MDLPDRLHDGTVVKVGERCWIEYLHTPAQDGIAARTGIRFTDQPGEMASAGVAIEGDELTILLDVLRRTHAV